MLTEYFRFRSTTAEAQSRLGRFWRLYVMPVFDFTLPILIICAVVAVIALGAAMATRWQVDPNNVHVIDCKVEASQPGYRLVRQEDGSLTMLKIDALLRHRRTDAQWQMLAMLMHPGAKLRVSYVQDSSGDKHVLKAVEMK